MCACAGIDCEYSSRVCHCNTVLVDEVEHRGRGRFKMTAEGTHGSLMVLLKREKSRRFAESRPVCVGLKTCFDSDSFFVYR